jgi:hypothetical protein
MVSGSNPEVRAFCFGGFKLKSITTKSVHQESTKTPVEVLMDFKWTLDRHLEKFWWTPN